MSQQQNNGWVQDHKGRWVPAPRPGPTGMQKAEFVTKSLLQLSLLVVFLGFLVLVLWALLTS